MIIYFADRKMNILGYASDRLKKGYIIQDDNKTEDVETGVAIFECTIGYNSATLQDLDQCMEVGNYILRSNDGEKEFYTIIESERDTKDQTIYIYAEDAGMDLLNEVVGPYTADKAYDIEYYINKFAIDSGFEIGINEIPDLTRTLSWDGDATATERIASVATQFDNAEISYSFETKGLIITHKYINIHKKRGKDSGIQLRLNREVDRIIVNKSIANLATGLEVTGGTPEGQDSAITLKGYTYDDGDMYVSGTKLLSRDALAKWSRYVWDKEPGKVEGYTGHIVRRYSYDTTSQSELCAHAVTELKNLSKIEVNYEIEISEFPENLKIGDRADIVDDGGEVYVSSRILKLETSVTGRSRKATLGEFLIKPAGISQKVLELAEQFAKTSLSAERAEKIAETAKQAADTAQISAEAAQQAADAAQSAVVTVEESVQGLQETAENAQTSADGAYDLAAENESQISETRSEVEQLSDALSTLIVGENGETMMEQTDVGWQFNMSSVLSRLETARDELDKQRDDIEGIDTTISNLDSLINDITKKTAYITMSTDDKGNPCIELGKQDSPFKLRITNESIDFVQDGVKIAYITNRQLYIQSSVVTDEMKVGAGSGFIWKKRQNGNMGLRWIEGS